MKVAVCYCYPMVKTTTYYPLAKRFAESWRQFPGENLHLLCNGSSPRPVELQPFLGIPYETHTCSNLGWDIGSFQWAADHIHCDLLVCLGAPIHFHQTRWLDRMVDAYVNHGPALYGCWAYLYPNWHVRTTAFWLPPELLQSYPNEVGSTRASRYDFEHGEHSITRHVMKFGFESYLVTAKNCFPFKQWDGNAPGPDDSLVLDQHTHY